MLEKQKLSEYWNECQNLSNQEKEYLYNQILDKMKNNKTELDLEYLGSKQSKACEWLKADHDIKCYEMSGFRCGFRTYYIASWGDIFYSIRIGNCDL